MGDHKGKPGKGQLAKAAASEAHAVRDLADKHDLTKDQAVDLIARHGEDHDLLAAAADKILKPEVLHPDTHLATTNLAKTDLPLAGTPKKS
ncbi:MAG: hypothetical protein B7Z15_00515 [Rhizobiales bacterium 32-66-8]|nr:MAG: hypothetical protein B7Z15_00515 [Rhizobiales bacterium 32-66-8]